VLVFVRIPWSGFIVTATALGLERLERLERSVAVERLELNETLERMQVDIHGDTITLRRCKKRLASNRGEDGGDQIIGEKEQKNQLITAAEIEGHARQ
jgi:hypothetical protein